MGKIMDFFGIPDFDQINKDIDATYSQWEFIGKGKKKYLLDEWDKYTIRIMSYLRPYDKEMYYVSRQVWGLKRYAINYDLFPTYMRDHLKEIMKGISEFLPYIEDPAFARRLGTVKFSVRTQDLDASIKFVFDFFLALYGLNNNYNVGMPEKATFEYNKKLGKKGGSDELMLKELSKWKALIDRFGKVCLYIYDRLERIEFDENGIRVW